MLPHDSDTPVTLLSRVRKNDDPAVFTEFDKRYRPFILAWCRKRGLQEANAEDLAQRILLRLWSLMKRFVYDPERGRFRAWLTTVIRKAIADYFRDLARHPVPVAPGGDAAQAAMQQIENSLLDDIDSVSEPFVRETDARQLAAMCAAIDRAKAQVEPKTWEVFVALLEEEETDPGKKKDAAKVVADRFGMSIVAVQKIKSRLKRMCNEAYEGDAPE